MGRLDGKVALVTGGARGQGEAEVRLFVQEGAKVVFGDVLDDLGKSVAEDLGDAAHYVHHDVRREDDWSTVVDEAVSRYGKLDILVNNAGVLSMGGLTHETSLEDYRRIIEINQIGVFLGMRTAIPTLLRNAGGSIVNISSANGLAGYGGTAAYTASKFAPRSWSRWRSTSMPPATTGPCCPTTSSTRRSCSRRIPTHRTRTGDRSGSRRRRGPTRGS